MNDYRSQIVGGMETAILLWEACCVPSLLNGAGTWVDISKATEKRLDQIHYWGLRLFLQTGPGTPLASLLWDFGFLNMAIRIKIEKILLIFHIRSLKEDTLAYRIYKEQIIQNWPGLARETKQICKDLGIEDCNTTLLNKVQFKKLLLQSCHRTNEQNLRLLAKGKCERIGVEEYGRKEYVQNKNIASVRHHFKTKWGLQPFAGNFSNDKKRFSKSNWLCKCEESRENESHLMAGQCKVYGDLTEKYSDFTDDNNLVQFFTEVLDRRDRLDKEQLDKERLDKEKLGGGQRLNSGA